MSTRTTHWIQSRCNSVLLKRPLKTYIQSALPRRSRQPLLRQACVALTCVTLFLCQTWGTAQANTSRTPAAASHKALSAANLVTHGDFEMNGGVAQIPSVRSLTGGALEAITNGSATFSAAPQEPPACFATIDAATVYSSTDASAVQQAVDAAGDGDTVKVAGACAGVQARGGTTQTVVLTKALTLQGGYASTDWTTSDPIAHLTTLDAQGAGRVVSATAVVTLSNLTVQNGRSIRASDDGDPNIAGNGGGAYFAITATVLGMTFVSNTASNDGGGLYATEGYLQIDGSQFISNSADLGGAVFARGATVNETTFDSNTASTQGGGMVAVAAIVTDTTFLHNAAGGDGGALFGFVAIVTGTTVVSNTAGNNGGGISTQFGAILTGTTFVSNTAGAVGGGLYAPSGLAEITDSRFEQNTAPTCGGAIGGLILLRATFIANTASDMGGGACAGEGAMVTDSVFQDNRAVNDGGGLLAASGDLFIDGTHFISNSANRGGAVYQMEGSTTLMDSSIEQGTAVTVSGLSTAGTLVMTNVNVLSNTTTGAYAGAIYAGGAAQISGGRFENNRTGGDGGALYVDGEASVSGATFISNTAGTGGGGAYFSTTVTLTGATFVSNTAGGNGGGVNVNDGDLTVVNSWFEGNEAANCGGARVSRILTALNTTFLSNEGYYGGGVCAGAGADVTDSLFQSNYAANGGGIKADSGIVRLVGTRLIGNEAYYGGGGDLDSDAYISNTDFLSNTAYYEEGAAYIDGDAVVVNSHFDYNRAISYSYGALQVGGNLVMTGTDFTRNEAYQSVGAVSAEGSMTITGSNFIQNSAGRYYGALYAGLTTTIVRSRFERNTADRGVAGFGSDGDVTLVDTVVLSNTTPGYYGGGVYADRSLTVNGLTLQGNTCAADCFGAGMVVSGDLTVMVGNGYAVSDDIELGSHLVNGGVVTVTSGAATFDGDIAQTIGGSSDSIFGGLRISNTHGVWLNRAATTLGALTLTTDLTVTAGYTLNLDANATSSGSGDVWGVTRRDTFVADRTYSFGNPNVAITFGASDSFDPRPESGAASTPADVTVNLQRGAPVDLTNAVSRVYTVTASGGAYSATLRLHYRDAELGSANEARLSLWRNDGAQWDWQQHSAADATGNWVERSGVTAFSAWALADAPVTSGTYTLTVGVAGTGGGVVTPSAGAHAYASGTVVALTATPDVSSTFAGWSGALSSMASAVTLTITGDTVVTATFRTIVADLGISQSVTHSASTYTYTLVVSNAGPADADGAVLSDTLVAGQGVGTLTCVAASPGVNSTRCTPPPPFATRLAEDGTVQVLSDTLTAFPSGSVVTYTLVINNLAPMDSVGNAAAIVAPAGVAEADPADNTTGTLQARFVLLLPMVFKGS